MRSGASGYEPLIWRGKPDPVYKELRNKRNRRAKVRSIPQPLFDRKVRTSLIAARLFADATKPTKAGRIVPSLSPIVQTPNARRLVSRGGGGAA
jgi:hypothetical protein